MKLSRFALAIAVVGLGLMGVLLLRAPNRPVVSKRPVRPYAMRIAPSEPEVAVPVPLPDRRVEKAPVAAPVSEASEEVAVTEIAMTPEVAEFCAMLELSEEVAARVVGLLGERDLAAERILEPYGNGLSVEAIVAVRPRLRMLDDETDRAIEAMLTLDQQRRYRGLRDEHFIPGTALEVPPAQLTDDSFDRDSDE